LRAIIDEIDDRYLGLDEVLVAHVPAIEIQADRIGILGVRDERRNQ
jgi:hypothetical protein